MFIILKPRLVTYKTALKSCIVIEFRVVSRAVPMEPVCCRSSIEYIRRRELLNFALSRLLVCVTHRAYDSRRFTTVIAFTYCTRPENNVYPRGVFVRTSIRYVTNSAYRMFFFYHYGWVYEGIAAGLSQVSIQDTRRGTRLCWLNGRFSFHLVRL